MKDYMQAPIKTLLNSFLFGTFMVLSTIYADAQIAKGTWLIGGNIGYNQNKGTTNDSSRNFNSSLSSYNNAYTSRTYTNSGYSVFVVPSIGYFISNNWLLGSAINLSYSQNTTDNVSNLLDKFHDHSLQLSRSIGLTPYVRYYYMINPKLGAFAQANLQFLYTYMNSYESLKDSSASYGFNSSGSNNNYNIKLSLQPGVVYFITPRIGLEALVGTIGLYNYSAGTSTNATTPSQGTLRQSSYKSSSSGFSANPFADLSHFSLGVFFYLGRR